MNDLNKAKQLLQTIIDHHETKDYDSLMPYVSEEEIEKASWFTRKRFMEVCEAIENEIGTITSLQHIETLKRRTLLLTLWKTKYSKSKDEVLWQVTLDAQNHKIKLMHINWEQQ